MRKASSTAFTFDAMNFDFNDATVSVMMTTADAFKTLRSSDDLNVILKPSKSSAGSKPKTNASQTKLRKPIPVTSRIPTGRQMLK